MPELEVASYARHFKQQALSDSDLVIRLRCAAVADELGPAARLRRPKKTAKQEGKHLACFPAHQIILCSSEYFQAQVESWKRSHQQEGGPSTSTSTARTTAARPSLELTLDTEHQLPAAEAVLSAMYGDKAYIARLEQDQLAYAAFLADLLMYRPAFQYAVGALKAAAVSEQGITAAGLRALATRMWPARMLELLIPLAKGFSQAVAQAEMDRHMEHILLCVFGDLQAVWEDHQLQELLLQLPLRAMQLLISSDQLRVLSEDTVLYTIHHYVCAQAEHQKAAATAALAPLLRAPHLSLQVMSWPFFATALDAHSGQNILAVHGPQLKQLYQIKRASSRLLKFADEVARIDDAPSSWQSGPRQIVPADGVTLRWSLPVVEIAAACRRCFSEKDYVSITSPRSGPLAGMAWQLIICCEYQNDGVALGTCLLPRYCPPGLFWGADFTFKCNGRTEHTGPSGVLMFSGERFGGFRHIKFDHMSGGDGWDEATWAAAGLPTSGELVMELHVREAW